MNCKGLPLDLFISRVRIMSRNSLLALRGPYSEFFIVAIIVALSTVESLHHPEPLKPDFGAGQSWVGFLSFSYL